MFRLANSSYCAVHVRVISFLPEVSQWSVFVRQVYELSTSYLSGLLIANTPSKPLH